MAKDEAMVFNTAAQILQMRGSYLSRCSLPGELDYTQPLVSMQPFLHALRQRTTMTTNQERIIPPTRAGVAA